MTMEKSMVIASFRRNLSCLPSIYSLHIIILINPKHQVFNKKYLKSLHYCQLCVNFVPTQFIGAK